MFLIIINLNSSSLKNFPLVNVKVAKKIMPILLRGLELMSKNLEEYLSSFIRSTPHRYYHAVTNMVCARLGTPVELSAKSIQYPGIAIPGSLGTVAVYEVPEPVGVSAIRL